MKVKFGEGNEVVRDNNAQFGRDPVAIGDVIDCYAAILGYDPGRVEAHVDGAVLSQGTVSNASFVVLVNKANEKAV